LWASSFPVIKIGLKGYSPFQLASLRFLTASALLAAVAPFLAVRLPRRQDVGSILALGFFGVAAYHVLINAGETLATASAAGFISNTAPLFTTAIARARGEHITWKGWTGLLIGLVGVWFISIGNPAAGEFALNPGCLFLVLAALCWSLFFVLQSPLLRRYSPLEVTCYAVWTGSLLLAVFLPGALAALPATGFTATLAALYLGILPTAAAYLAWGYVLANIRLSQASIYTYLVPILSAVMAYLWLGEEPTLLFFLGAVGVLVGVMVAHEFQPIPDSRD
jgi:drug/metabolite transporter (DMT)-like permease